jgi:hypothetical protein
MNLTAVSDPTNTGLFFNPLQGEESFEDKFLFATKNMSKQQKDVARVPIHFIPDIQAIKLREEIEEAGGIATDSILEAYAGATVVNDEARKKKIIAASKKE